MMPARNAEANLKASLSPCLRKVRSRRKIPATQESYGLRIEIFDKLEGLDGDGWIVFVGVANGKTVKEISEGLKLSLCETASYLRDIKKRLGVEKKGDIPKLAFIKK